MARHAGVKVMVCALALDQPYGPLVVAALLVTSVVRIAVRR